jgi:oxygen-independent coproporphyrinogen-3 oxidase
VLAASQVHGILDAMARNFRLAPAAEITLEANPEDVTLHWLRGIREAGVNRLSLGVQSFADRDLRFLRRTHDAGQARRAVATARDAGFANVGIDLIIGLETQSAGSMEANYRAIAALRPGHVSVYILEGVSRSVDDERDARLYFQARRRLLELGFRHYEVSNFCRPGRASRHNLKYWRMEPYIGLGASAAGYLGGRDYRNIRDLRRYGAALTHAKLAEARTRQLDPAKRRIITGLRLLEGIPSSAFAPFSAASDFLISEGFLARRGRNIAVPAERILLLNEILGYFV